MCRIPQILLVTATEFWSKWRESFNVNLTQPGLFYPTATSLTVTEFMVYKVGQNH